MLARKQSLSREAEAAGAFMQVSGLSFTYDTSRQAQVIEKGTSNIVTPGERVRDVTSRE